MELIAGSALRWWIGRLVGEGYKGRFPLGTFLINISGSLAIGYLSVLFNVDWHNRHGHGMVLNAFVITGVLGGYTRGCQLSRRVWRVSGPPEDNRVPAFLTLAGRVDYGGKRSDRIQRLGPPIFIPPMTAT
jgi:fluoride exporter